MHELSIALSLLDIASEESERRDGVRIDAIHIRLGALSGVVSEALQSAFQLARQSTSFPNCRLEILSVPLRVFCPECQAEREVEAIYSLQCAVCGTLSGDIVNGREMEVVAMEIEDRQAGDKATSPETALTLSEDPEP